MLTPAETDVDLVLEEVERINSNTESRCSRSAVCPPDNVLAHYHHTAPEIWEQTEGKVMFIMCQEPGHSNRHRQVFKEKNPHIKVFISSRGFPDSGPAVSATPGAGHC